MAPALLGAEGDRGMPVNTGLYLGGAAVLSTMLDTEELIELFRGNLPSGIAGKKMTRNPVTNQTAPFVMGIKDHMGHFLLSDENIDRLYEITSGAGLIFMSHTQDMEHTLRVEGLSRGRALHLGHANAAGCGERGRACEKYANGHKALQKRAHHRGICYDHAAPGPWQPGGDPNGAKRAANRL
jgi:hypothetical protein